MERLEAFEAMLADLTRQADYEKQQMEQLKAAGKTSAFFYDWEELRDLSRPASLSYSFFASGIPVRRP